MSAGGRDTRWILGFDGGCAACSKMAKDIVAMADGKLLAAPLRSCLLLRWREQALGSDAPWLPTLFRVEGEEVRAWTGPAMGWQLGGLLGPGKTWRIVRMLGELNSSEEPEGAADLSRRHAVKALGGAALALGLNVGTQKLSPSPVSAQDVSAAGQPRLTFKEPDGPVRRRMEEAYRVEELRTFRAWLAEHGYKNEEAARYGMTFRNGQLWFRSVAESWREAGRVAVVNLAIMANGKKEWTVNVYRESDSKLLQRLRLNEVKRVYNEPGDGISAAWSLFGISDCNWCNIGCSAIMASGVLQTTAACVLVVGLVLGPFAGAVATPLCFAYFAGMAAFWVVEGCPWVCDEIGLC